MGPLPTQTHRYAAFISYAHADEVMAARLHKSLETYPVPKHLRAQGKTTKPVFRDVAELTAAHSLSEKIQEAVSGSRVLIVLCSPAAKASHWVNEEIRLFRELHGDASILSAIIEGTPETAFPAALIEGGREPLAAALRADKPGFKLGVTQLAAGMLGTGLDELVRRGAKRRQRMMGAGLAASLALSGVMGFATLQAVEARKEAESARGDAEGLVEYMIKDLKFKLEPVGRLDLLEGIGDKAVEYYDKQDIKDLPDDSLTRQAAARQVLAQVHLDAGRIEEAQKEIEASAALTREVLERNPDDTDAIFAHAQSEYWVGSYYQKQGKLGSAEKPLREYDRLAQILYKKDLTNFDWVMEAAWGKNNLGFWMREHDNQELYPEVLEYYTRSIELFDEAITLKPTSKLAIIEKANAISGKAKILIVTANAVEAKDYQLKHLKLMNELIFKFPDDMSLKREFYLAYLDYYNGYFLKYGPKEKTASVEALDGLFDAVENDPENSETAILYTRAVINLMELLDTESIIHKKTQVIEIIDNVPKNEGLNEDYLKSMIQIMDIIIDMNYGNEILAVSKLNKLNNKYLNQEVYTVDDWRLLYAILHKNVELENDQYIKPLAVRFLKVIAEHNFPQHPSILNRKLNAHAVLNDCENIAFLQKTLNNRGYNAVFIDGLKPCS